MKNPKQNISQPNLTELYIINKMIDFSNESLI